MAAIASAIDSISKIEVARANSGMTEWYAGRIKDLSDELIRLSREPSK